MDFVAALQEQEISFRYETVDACGLIFLADLQVAINPCSLLSAKTPDELIKLQTACQKKGIYLVHLWEDVWATRKAQVMGRIASILGLNYKLHGRKASVISINQKEADDFLDAHHLQSSAKAKHKFGLTIEGQLVAVALFSGGLQMKRIAPDYRSFELIRFASLSGYTVTGGFSKLLKHFIKLLQPNDVMSYADRDWSLGNAYEQSGFKLVSETPASEMWLDRSDYKRYFPHRLPSAIQAVLALLNKEQQREFLLKKDYLPIFNTGNLKYILYL